MVWKQRIDGIPVSDIWVRNDTREVYNFRCGLTNKKLNSYNSTLNVMYVGKEWADQAGKYYLYPLWVFAVHEETGYVNEGKNWMYYLVDAITGELFVDFPEELLQ